jgi:hypothetical protein
MDKCARELSSERGSSVSMPSTPSRERCSREVGKGKQGEDEERNLGQPLILKC